MTSIRFLVFASTLCLALTVDGCAERMPVAGPPSRSDLVADLTSKTVALVLPDTSRSYCSGVWVGAKFFVTAQHCVSDEPGFASYVTAQDIDDFRSIGGSLALERRIASIIASDEVNDLVLLRDDLAPPHLAAHLAASVWQGEPAFTMGHPLNLLWSFSAGDVAAIRWMDDAVSDIRGWRVQATTPIGPGNSGCGLFDTSGRLLGIAQAAAERGENLNLFIHRDHVEAFLRAQHLLP